MVTGSRIGRLHVLQRVLRLWGCALGILIFGAGSVHAACTVDGVPNGPIANGSMIVCSGVNSTPINTTAEGVSLTLTPGSSLVVPAGTEAITLGNYAFVDLQVGSVVSADQGRDKSVVDVGGESVVSMSGSVIARGSERLAFSGGGVLALYGQVNGMISQAHSLNILIYPGASIGQLFWVRYVSNAGTASSVTANPIYANQEVYNEPGGRISNGVEHVGWFRAGLFGPNLHALNDSIVINRGIIDPIPGYGASLYAAGNDQFGNIQFTNEEGGIMNGRVQLARGFRDGSSFGINRGTITGVLELSGSREPAVPDYPPARYGKDQTFENFGIVNSVDVESGLFIQRPLGTFAANATLRILVSTADYPLDIRGHYIGRARIEGAHSVACLVGSSDPPATFEGGGILDLATGATLTVRPGAGQSCDFQGVVVGTGRLVKDGAGSQTIGERPHNVPIAVFVRPPTSFSGGTEIKAGTLRVVASDALGTGPVQFTGTDARLQAGADALNVANPMQFALQSVIDSGTLTLTLSGASSGSAVVRKLGDGMLVWPGARGHTGQTRVEAGTLRLSGNLAGPLRGYNGATIEGQANVSGALVLDAGAILRVRIGAGGVNGFAASAAAIAGNLELVEDAPPPLGTTSVLLAVGGSAPASGTFAGRPEGSRIDIGQSTYRISYQGGDGNDVTLRRIAPLLAPTNVVATPGNTQISLSFDPPPANGEPIGGYRATCAPGNIVVEGAVSPLLVTGLGNGSSYTCDLVALGVDGPGAAATVSATPRTVPGAPREPVGAGPSGTLEVAFLPPLSDGGAAVQSYTLTCVANGSWQATGVASPLAIQGVPDAQRYSCSVVATNVAGDGPASDSVEIVPGVVPTAVRDVFVVNGDGTAGIDFEPPMIGAPILDYRAVCQPGDVSQTNPAPPLLLVGLNNGSTYDCAVSARNAMGHGPAVQALLRPTAVMFGDGFE